MTNPQLFPDPVPTLWTPDQQLRALSWKQPYAELMLHDKIETRTWGTAWRGWVMICASKKKYSFQEFIEISGWKQYERAGNDLFETNKFDVSGHTVAIGYLSDCRPMTPEDEDAAFVLYRPDLWCHIYTNVKAITPLPWKGSQGWREVGPEFKNQIKFLKA